MVAEDDVVVEVFTASGTHRGELLGVPGTGRTLVLRGINVFRVEGDRIAERWGRVDELGLARQLGLVAG
jgi:predicted ester cyclase